LATSRTFYQITKIHKFLVMGGFAVVYTGTNARGKCVVIKIPHVKIGNSLDIPLRIEVA